MVLRIAVIGAGIVGLSSAVAVQNRLPEAQVTVIAENFTTHTSSFGSGGLFMSRFDTPDTLQWARDSAKYFFSLARSADAGISGVNFITGFFLYNGDSDQFPAWTKDMVNVQKVPAQLQTIFHKFYKHGCMVTTAVIEGAKYLPWLTDRFIAGGGRVVQKSVESFDELCGDHDLVLNCAGLGAGQLASDPKVHPVRGHIVRVSAPWLTYFINTDDTHYFIPHSESAVVGGTLQPGRYDLGPEPEESRRIMREMEERLPPLKGAKVLHDWIGLRPARHSVRLEAQTLNCKGKQLKVVHNYGHGAYGVSLSWGTALQAAQLAQHSLGVTSKL